MISQSNDYINKHLCNPMQE